MRRLLHAVRRHMPAAARKSIYRAGVFFGDEFVNRAAQFDTGSGPSTLKTLGYLRDWGFSPRTIVDVGAFRGDWTRMAKTRVPLC